MKVKSPVLAVIIITLIFGGIALTSALGLWETVNDKIPERYSEGEFKGEYNPADIRGSYTFGDISELFEIPLEDLGKAFSIKNGTSFAEFQVKELETIYEAYKLEGKEVGTDSVRIFTALYKALPITLNEDTFLPQPAASILKSKAVLTAEQSEYLENHTVIPLENSISSSEEPPAGDSGETIKGKTTFKELIDWGVKKEDIEKVINQTIPDINETIKNFAEKTGVEFSSLKEPLQALVDQL